MSDARQLYPNHPINPGAMLKGTDIPSGFKAETLYSILQLHS